jgi:DNA-binding winged helix-turn-helix (wHTH) protein
MVMPVPSRFFISDNLRFDVAARELCRVESDGSAKPLPLGSRATDILVLFIQRPGDLVTKSEIMETVWPNTVVEESNLGVQISALRRALEDAGDNSKVILAVPGRGYRFMLPVRSEEETRTDQVSAPAGLPRLELDQLSSDELNSNTSRDASESQPGAVTPMAHRYCFRRATTWAMLGAGAAALVAIALAVTVSGSELLAGVYRPQAAALSAGQRTTREEARCTNLPGIWEWFSGKNAYFYPDGNLRGGGFSGSWACADGNVVIAWSHGHTDRVTISPNGTYLSGANDIAAPVWGRRIGNL